MIRVRKLHGKCREFYVYKLILSHLRKPKTRNMSPKFTQLVTDGLELNHQGLTRHIPTCDIQEVSKVVPTTERGRVHIYFHTKHGSEMSKSIDHRRLQSADPHLKSMRHARGRKAVVCLRCAKRCTRGGGDTACILRASGVATAETGHKCVCCPRLRDSVSFLEDMQYRKLLLWPSLYRLYVKKG